MYTASKTLNQQTSNQQEDGLVTAIAQQSAQEVFESEPDYLQKGPKVGGGRYDLQLGSVMSIPHDPQTNAPHIHNLLNLDFNHDSLQQPPTHLNEVNPKKGQAQMIVDRYDQRDKMSAMSLLNTSHGGHGQGGVPPLDNYTTTRYQNRHSSSKESMLRISAHQSSLDQDQDCGYQTNPKSNKAIIQRSPLNKIDQNQQPPIMTLGATLALDKDAQVVDTNGVSTSVVKGGTRYSSGAAGLDNNTQQRKQHNPPIQQPNSIDISNQPQTRKKQEQSVARTNQKGKVGQMRQLNSHQTSQHNLKVNQQAQESSSSQMGLGLGEGGRFKQQPQSDTKPIDDSKMFKNGRRVLLLPSKTSSSSTANAAVTINNEQHQYRQQTEVHSRDRDRGGISSESRKKVGIVIRKIIKQQHRDRSVTTSDSTTHIDQQNDHAGATIIKSMADHNQTPEKDSQIEQSAGKQARLVDRSGHTNTGAGRGFPLQIPRSQVQIFDEDQNHQSSFTNVEQNQIIQQREREFPRTTAIQCAEQDLCHSPDVLIKKRLIQHRGPTLAASKTNTERAPSRRNVFGRVAITENKEQNSPFQSFQTAKGQGKGAALNAFSRNNSKNQGAYLNQTTTGQILNQSMRNKSPMLIHHNGEIQTNQQLENNEETENRDMDQNNKGVDKRSDDLSVSDKKSQQSQERFSRVLQQSDQNAGGQHVRGEIRALLSRRQTSRKRATKMGSRQQRNVNNKTSNALFNDNNSSVVFSSTMHDSQINAFNATIDNETSSVGEGRVITGGAVARNRAIQNLESTPEHNGSSFRRGQAAFSQIKERSFSVQPAAEQPFHTLKSLSKVVQERLWPVSRENHNSTFVEESAALANNNKEDHYQIDNMFESLRADSGSVCKNKNIYHPMRMDYQGTKELKQEGVKAEIAAQDAMRSFGPNQTKVPFITMDSMNSTKFLGKSNLRSTGRQFHQSNKIESFQTLAQTGDQLSQLSNQLPIKNQIGEGRAAILEDLKQSKFEEARKKTIKSVTKFSRIGPQNLNFSSQRVGDKGQLGVDQLSQNSDFSHEQPKFKDSAAAHQQGVKDALLKIKKQNLNLSISPLKRRGQAAFQTVSSHERRITDSEKSPIFVQVNQQKDHSPETSSNFGIESGRIAVKNSLENSFSSANNTLVQQRPIKLGNTINLAKLSMALKSHSSLKISQKISPEELRKQAGNVSSLQKEEMSSIASILNETLSKLKRPNKHFLTPLDPKLTLNSSKKVSQNGNNNKNNLEQINQQSKIPPVIRKLSIGMQKVGDQSVNNLNSAGGRANEMQSPQARLSIRNLIQNIGHNVKNPINQSTDDPKNSSAKNKADKDQQPQKVKQNISEQNQIDEDKLEKEKDVIEEVPDDEEICEEVDLDELTQEDKFYLIQQIEDIQKNIRYYSSTTANSNQGAYVFQDFEENNSGTTVGTRYADESPIVKGMKTNQAQFGFGSAQQAGNQRDRLGQKKINLTAADQNGGKKNFSAQNPIQHLGSALGQHIQESLEIIEDADEQEEDEIEHISLPDDLQIQDNQMQSPKQLQTTQQHLNSDNNKHGTPFELSNANNLENDQPNFTKMAKNKRQNKNQGQIQILNARDLKRFKGGAIGCGIGGLVDTSKAARDTETAKNHPDDDILSSSSGIDKTPLRKQEEMICGSSTLKKSTSFAKRKSRQVQEFEQQVVGMQKRGDNSQERKEDGELRFSKTSSLDNINQLLDDEDENESENAAITLVNKSISKQQKKGVSPNKRHLLVRQQSSFGRSNCLTNSLFMDHADFKTQDEQKQYLQQQNSPASSHSKETTNNC